MLTKWGLFRRQEGGPILLTCVARPAPSPRGGPHFVNMCCSACSVAKRGPHFVNMCCSACSVAKRGAPFVNMKQGVIMNTVNSTCDDKSYKEMMKVFDLIALPRFLLKMVSESTPRGGIFESGHPDAAKSFLVCTTSTGRNVATKLLDLSALPRFLWKGLGKRKKLLR